MDYKPRTSESIAREFRKAKTPQQVKALRDSVLDITATLLVDLDHKRALIKSLEKKLKAVERCGPGAAMLATATASRIRKLKKEINQ
jgi:hypothetical protein